MLDHQLEKAGDAGELGAGEEPRGGGLDGRSAPDGGRDEQAARSSRNAARRTRPGTAEPLAEIGHDAIDAPVAICELLRRVWPLRAAAAGRRRQRERVDR